MEKSSRNAEFASANVETQAVVELTSDEILSNMQRYVQAAAGKPETWGSNIKLGITVAARVLKLSYREAKGYWYRELAEPKTSKYLRVAARYQALCGAEASKNEKQAIELKDRIELERACQVGTRDADFTSLDSTLVPVDRRTTR